MVRGSKYLLILFLPFLTLAGCADSEAPSKFSVMPAPASSGFANSGSSSLPMVTGSKLQSFVEKSEVPVLVEFGVDHQCERCRQMKQPVVELGEEFEGRAKVVRVDFTANTGLVSRLGGTICPTYVFFQDGKPVRTESFPISADLLATYLDTMLDPKPANSANTNHRE